MTSIVIYESVGHFAMLWAKFQKDCLTKIDTVDKHNFCQISAEFGFGAYSLYFCQPRATVIIPCKQEIGLCMQTNGYLCDFFPDIRAGLTEVQQSGAM